MTRAPDKNSNAKDTFNNDDDNEDTNGNLVDISDDTLYIE